VNDNEFFLGGLGPLVDRRMKVTAFQRFGPALLLTLSDVLAVSS
jgi:hypothetical protein